MDKGNEDKMKNSIYKKEKLSKYSWFNLGGPAETLFKPESIEDLKKFLKNNINNKQIHVLGAGSNTLFRDLGFPGIVIKLGKNFSYTRLLKNNQIEVGAATLDKKVSDFAKENSLSGLEFLSCIPGSIGGAITMNSGCYGYDISQSLVSLNAISFDGEIISYNKDQINFFYRGNSLKNNLIFLSAIFQCEYSKKQIIEKKQIDFKSQKDKSQPSKIKTCGSTFKNPPNKKAWKLIESSSCSDLIVGGASMSPKHSNFFINNGKATSEDIENLIKKVKEKVFLKTGINLELEIKIIGKK